MKRTVLIPTAIVVMLALATAQRASAYGVCHAGYTTCGAGGVQHYGATAAVGPYGAVAHTGKTTATPYGVQHTGTTTVGNAGGSASVSTTRAYSPTTYGGYSAVGTSGTATHAGVVYTGAYR